MKNIPKYSEPGTVPARILERLTEPDNQLKMLEIFLDDMTVSDENAGEFAHLCLDIAYQNAKTSLARYKKFRSLAEKIGDLIGRDLAGEFPWEDPDQLSLALCL